MITFQKRYTLILLTLAFTCSLASVKAQESTPKNNKANRTVKMIQENAGRPDIPGDLVIEFGFSWMNDAPSGYGFKTMASRTFNAYYFYNKQIGESAFSFRPGLGIGTDKYAFAENVTLGYGLDISGEKQVEFIELDDIYGVQTTYKKSQINPNYFDIPMEIRWVAKKYDPKASVKIMLGGKFGVLFDSKTKVKYEKDGETRVTKEKERFGLNPIRYGVYAKIGIGGLSAFCYYSLSDTFKKDEGPMNTTMYPITFGLSMALF